MKYSLEKALLFNEGVQKGYNLKFLKKKKMPNS